LIQGKKVLGVIPARGGSKGVPGKNIRIVAGKPLIAWTIEAAKKSNYLDRVILSSDDPEIIRVAKEWNLEVPFVRPADLARDDTPGIEPVLHALAELPGFDYVVLLQPTSPLRTVEDIDRCIERCLKLKAPSCVSVTVPDKSPYLMYTLEGQNLRPLLRHNAYACRQDMPKVLALNGAVYVAQIDWLHEKKVFVSEETVACEMPKERSIDIDEEIDLKFIQNLLSSE
jgi:CMP-N,N'-diacetyllegionaminic acid synthase